MELIFFVKFFFAGPASAAVEQKDSFGEDSFGESRLAVEKLEQIPLESDNEDWPEDTSLGSAHYHPSETPLKS